MPESETHVVFEAGWVSPPLSFALSCHAPSVLFVLPAVADSELHGS